MREINAIVIHCSATKANADIGLDEIRKWHTGPKGNGWRDVGYHLIIRRDGGIEKGRPIEEIGAHVVGHNADSIGVCLVGGLDENMRPAANYTPAQWAALKEVVADLKKLFPAAAIKGHCDYPNVAKACPCFDVSGWSRKAGLSNDRAA